MLDPQGPFASKPDGLFKIVLVIAAFVFVFVQGLIILTAMRYRDKGDDDTLPVQVHGNTRLEILWTVIPAVILAAIAVPTIQQVFELDREPDDALIVEVIGHRWWWEYRYPDSGIITANELVIPVGQPVRLEMRAEEEGRPDKGVIHSYWVPALGGKQDVVPGRVTTLNIQADAEGRYLGQCTEYCGLSHANMRNRAVAVSADEFYNEWIPAQQQGATVPEGNQLAMQGREVFANNCAACHSINENPVASADDFVATRGPNLTHLMSRKEFAGAIFDLYLRDADGEFTDQVNLEQLRAWVKDAPGQKAMRPPDIGMYSFAEGGDALTDEELEAVVEYLTTLQ
jgi:cytochrome c oxidase subunit 2